MTVVAHGISGRSRTHKALRRFGLPLIGVLLVGVILLPVYFMIVVSFEPSSTLQAEPLTIFPHQWVIANYGQAISKEWGSILTSLVIGLGTVALSTLVGLPAAYGLMRYRLLNGRFLTSTIAIVLLGTQMIPQISLSLAFYNLFHHLGLLDSYPGLILADSTGAIPFFILVVRAYLSSIPPEIMDAAAIDGCSELRTLRSIILPMAVPGIVTASVFVFLMGWSDFIFALTLTIGGHLSPLTVGLYRFIGIDVTAYGPIMATVVFAAIPSGIMLAFAQRYIMGGLRAGALKG